MATITCTSCGLRGSDADAFCTRCGMSRTGGPSRGSRSGSGSRVGMWIAVAAACGLGGVFVIGILAAIAIPKFASVSRAAKEAEAAPILKQIHTLQQSFHQTNGRYTANLEDPQAPGFLAGYQDVGARYFTFSVSRAEADALCIEAHPSEEGASAGVQPTSMDGAGTQYTGPNCVDTPAEGWQMTMEEVAGDSEAGPVLRRVLALQTQSRKESGRFVSDLADLEGAESLDNRFFTFAVSRATEDVLCVEARLTPPGRAAGLAESSLDQDGYQYLSLGCTGVRTTKDREPEGGAGRRSEKEESETGTVVGSEVAEP